MGPSYTNIGPARGPMMDRDATHAIGVLEAPDNHMPIGMALCVTRDPAGVALWRLSVRGAELPGRWVLFDRQFEWAWE